MGLKQDLPTKTRCDACLIRFEPKTRKVESKEGGRVMVYHHGCWAKINKAILHGYQDDDQEEFFSRG